MPRAFRVHFEHAQYSPEFIEEARIEFVEKFKIDEADVIKWTARHIKKDSADPEI